MYQDWLDITNYWHVHWSFNKTSGIVKSTNRLSLYKNTQQLFQFSLISSTPYFLHEIYFHHPEYYHQALQNTTSNTSNPFLYCKIYKHLSYIQLTLPSYDIHMNYMQQQSSPDWVWRTWFNITNHSLIGRELINETQNYYTHPDFWWSQLPWPSSWVPRWCCVSVIGW